MQPVLSENAAKCGPALTGDEACAISNAVPTQAPWPYTPKSGAPGTFPQFSFFEGGINITAVFNGATPPCFSSFLAETRSSTSLTAVLKDFVVGAFPVCGIEITKTCPSSRFNADQTAFIYSYNGTVTNTGFGSLYDVTVVDDAGTPGVPGDDQQVLSLPSLAAHTCAPYSGSYRPSGVNGSDPTSVVFSDTVTARGTPRPGGPALTDMHTATCPLCPCPRPSP